MNRSSARMRFAAFAAIGVCCVVAAVVIANLWSTSEDAFSLPNVRPGWAALAMVCMLGATLTYAVSWWLLMTALERKPVAFRPAVQLFLLSWPGRYVPGSLPYYGGRLVAGPGAGLSRTAVAASLVYENLFAIAGAGLLAMCLFVAGFHDRIAGSLWATAAIATALLAVFVIHPAVMRMCIRIAGHWFHRLRALDDYVLSIRALVRVGAAYTGGAVFAGLSFYFAIRAVAPDAEAPLLLAIAAYNVAGIAGMLAFAVPSGLGVREGTVVALLGLAVSPPAALAAAVLARLIAVAADFTPLALIVAWHALRRMFGRSPERVAGSPETQPAGVR